ncbi:MAG: hypothetical protein N2C14_06485, partial [Planctomycetales bacterium]
CGQRYSVQDQAAGKSVTCQKCQLPIQVPQPASGSVPLTPASGAAPLDPLVPLNPAGGQSAAGSPAGLTLLGSGDPFATPAGGSGTMNPGSPTPPAFGTPQPPPKSSGGGNPLANAPPMVLVGVGIGGGAVVLLLVASLFFLFSGGEEDDSKVADASTSSPTTSYQPPPQVVSPSPTNPVTPSSVEEPSSPTTSPGGGGSLLPSAPTQLQARPGGAAEPGSPTASPTGRSSLLPSGPTQLQARSGGDSGSGVEQPGGGADAPEDWSVEVDPFTEEIKWPGKINISLPSSVKVWYPATPSEYVAVYNNDFRNSGCAVFKLSSGRKTPGGVAGEMSKFGTPVAAVSPDGKLFALVQGNSPFGASLPDVGSRSKTFISIFDVKTGKPTQKVPGKPAALAFASPNILVAQGSSLIIHDVAANKTLHEISLGKKDRWGANSKTANTLAISPGGRFAAAAVGRAVSIYEIKTGKLAGVVKFSGKSDSVGIGFSQDGASLAAVGGDSDTLRLTVWDVATGRRRLHHPITSDDGIPGGAFRSPSVSWLADGAALLVGGHLIVDRDSGSVLHAYPSEQGSKLPRMPITDGRILGIVSSGGFNPSILTAAKPPSSEKLNQVRAVTKIGGKPVDADLPPLTAIDLSELKEIIPEDAGWTYQPDGAPLAESKVRKKVSIRALQFSRIRFAGYGVPKAVGLQSAGVRSNSGGKRPEPPKISEIALLDLEGSKIARRIKLGANPYRLMDVSADGESVLVGLNPTSEGSARLDVYSLAEKSGHVVGWRPHAQEPTDRKSTSSKSKAVKWAAFTAGNQVVTINGDNKLTAWSLPDCKAIYSIASFGRVLAMSPGRKYLLCQDRAAKISLLDLASGNIAGRMPMWAAKAAFSPQGDEIAVLAYPKIIMVNLTDGTTTDEYTIPARAAFTRVQWDERFIILGRRVLIDRKSKTAVWSFQANYASLAGAPDRRLWFVDDGQLVGAPTPSAKTLAAIASVPKLKGAIVTPGSSVAMNSISVNLEDMSREEALEIVTKAFERNDVTIDPNAPVKVRLSTDEESTGGTLTDDDNTLSVDHRKITVRIEIIGPDGETAGKQLIVNMANSARGKIDELEGKLNNRMHAGAASVLHSLFIPQYVFPPRMVRGTTRLSSTVETIILPNAEAE